MKNQFRNIFYVLFLLFFISLIGNFFINNSKIKKNNEWVIIFNGKDLTDWNIKIKDHKLGENFKNTFKVDNGNLKVSYENYNSFDNKFGHIFYTKRKFKNYHLSLEYKFSGVHLEGAPGWSVKNSGIMLHCQDPETMLIDQEFPISAEVQLLGGLGTGERTTANICSPGTDVYINKELAKYHCNNSNSKTYHEDDWVKVEVIVQSNNIIKHIVEGDTVLTYTNVKIGGDKVPFNYLNDIGKPLDEGYISLQSEGHPIEFRKIKIRDLDL